jgi:hypothetical protein
MTADSRDLKLSEIWRFSGILSFNQNTGKAEQMSCAQKQLFGLT